MAKKNDTMEKLVSLAKRRGYVFPSSEIYGGFGSTWDYGPLGVELKRNVKDVWWRSMVWDRDDVVGSMRPSSCTRTSGRLAAISRASPTRWWNAESATGAGVRTSSRSEHVPPAAVI